MLLALRVAPCQVRLQGSLSSLQPTTGRLCRKDEEQIRLQGSLYLMATRYGRSVPPAREPIAGALSSQSRVAATNWKAGAGCPVPQAGGQRKVVLARHV